jgi:hypothetical protein
MRGPFDDQGELFSYISPEQRVPTQHPLRTIRELVREVFRDLDHDFRTLYSTTGRPSIPPEQWLSALLRHIPASRLARTRPMMLRNMWRACGQRTSSRTSPSTRMSRRPDTETPVRKEGFSADC